MLRLEDEWLRLTLRGVPPIWCHVATPLAPLFVTHAIWGSMRWAEMALAAIVIAGMVLSTLMHELGHAWAARRFGLATESITITAGGGLARFESEPWTRRIDRLITAAGPAMNLAIGGMCLGIYWLFTSRPEIAGSFYRMPYRQPAPLRVMEWVGWFNIVVAAVNLLPAWPLDGGHLAATWIDRRWGVRRARLWVGISGVALAVFAKIVFVITLVGGFPIWMPPYFKPNWDAVRIARRR